MGRALCKRRAFVRKLGGVCRAATLCRMNKRVMPRLRKRLQLMLSSGGAYTTDVCAGGFAVELMRTLLPGSTVHGSVKVDDTSLPFTGVVTWTKQAEPRMQLRGRSGIRFTGIDSAFFSWLMRVA